MNLPNWIAAPLAIGLFVGFVYLAKSGKLKELEAKIKDVFKKD